LLQWGLLLWWAIQQQVVIAGEAEVEEAKQVLQLVRSKFMPHAVVLLHEPGQGGSAIEQIIPFVKSQTATDGKTTVYVCENYVCNQPVNKIDDLNKMLSDVSRVK
jgi:uncharacterized protein YyaL (SSP411 family)